MRRPIIGITATSRREKADEPERVWLNAAYVNAVIRAGGLPAITPPSPEHDAAALLEHVDGVLFTGGEDVDPTLFGQAAHPALGRVTPARDGWEIALARAARARGVPVLGVCRGIQVLNVAFGGTLVQDIPSLHPGALAHAQLEPRAERTHPVRIEAGSQLAAVLGTQLHVNSMHHQAVAELAPGFAATATASDATIEGMEWTADDWWCIAVQWHPEELDGADLKLFTALAERASRR